MIFTALRKVTTDATGLPRGVSRSQLQVDDDRASDATGLPRGVSRSQLQVDDDRVSDATGLPRGSLTLLMPGAVRLHATA